MYGWVCVAMVSPQGAVPSGESTITVMRAYGRKLGHCSSANCGVALSGVMLWCGWTTGGMPSFRPIQ